ncbi:MAG: phosphopantetheine-binding protein [Ignavibacteriales bacterium]|nr:phosphopantetheine-binding protein [Ignavibacteriales bacterium]
MERSEVEARVKKVIGNVLKINPDTISSTANFVFDLGADSMQSLQLIAGFEEEFDVQMDEDKALEVQSVADAVDFLKSLVEAKG